MRKKSCVVLVLFLILTLVLGTSCSKNNKYGSVNKVKMETQKDDTEKENVFNGLKDSFGYNYKTISDRREYMSFPCPSNWTVNKISDRDILIQAPASDPHFHGVTLHVFYSHSLYNENRNDTSKYYSIFKQDIYRANYYINNEAVSQTTYKHPTIISTKTDFAPKHGDMLSYGITKDVSMGTSSSDSISNEVTGNDFFVKWAGVPCVFSCYADSKYSNKVKTLLRFMVSNIKYTSPKVYDTSVVTKNSLSILIPAEFSKTSTDTYVSPISSKYGYSGMSVSLDTLSKGKICFDSLNSTYAKQYFEQSFADDLSGYNNVYCCESSKKVNIAGKTAIKYTSSMSIMKNLDAGNGFYEYGDTYYLDTYIINDNGKQNIINFVYDSSQSKEQAKIEYIIEKSAKLQ